MLFFVKYKPKLRTKILLGGVFLFSIFVVQSVKVDYRKLTWEDGGGKKNGDVLLLASLFGEKISNPKGVLDLPQVLNVLNRFNQGYIISHTYHHVPKSEPFANGETVLSALAASAVPRIVWPNKPKVGGGEIFPRFTGLELLGRTSANISPMGEAYVNFGRRGAMVFMFMFGLFLKFCFSFCLKIAQLRPYFLFWIPVLFLSTILLGTDLLSILNSIIKSAVFIWGFYWSVLLFFRVRIF